MSRVQKIKVIADNSTVQKYFQVCNLQRENCSVCSKCMRTEMSLYSMGKLDKFDKSFKLAEFEKEKNKYILKMMYKKGPFDIENLELMKNNGISIPTLIKVEGRILRPIYLVKEFIVRNKLLLLLYKKMRRNEKTNVLEEIERYNIDKEFAKSCDSGIV